ncbi:hypothetical protein BS636_03725 [Acinetobacter sp. LoGeW2-3]|uniref:hypothetical protein n=1 Tax=Acinetobacter sp. LoGeW2-3 TaxID=1808001 RepID=UPI000C058B7A|nr:hypothetical protein [Acinetobacter sp. LoGeW2-3]ATO18834.1 hypothetical protein BS636_03725 [Acinetobacter sp. LoGeW2-3]
MEKQIVFEDEHIRAIFMPGSSSELIFSFGDLITRAKGTTINAEKSLQKFEFNVLGIMPKDKSWFPQASMQAMLEAIAELITPFEQRIAYGGSMGGYAAIKYSNALDVQRAVAMVPQYSIDPEDVKDARYNMFYQPDLNGEMRITTADVSEDREYIIIYDPHYPQDRAHYHKLREVLPPHYVLHLAFTNHDAIAVLASSELVNDFLLHEFDASYFYQKMRRVKKNSKFYYRKVIENLLPRHRMALGRILKNNDLQLDSQFFDANQKQTILRELLSNKQVDQHDLMKLGIQVNLPQENRQILLDIYGHGLVFNVISNKIESYADQAIALNHKFLIPIYARGNGLLTISLNDERYLVVMNDRHMMKLVKEQEPLSVGMHPILMKRYPDFYMFSYKELSLKTDEYGAAAFVDDSDKNTHFVTRSEAN